MELNPTAFDATTEDITSGTEQDSTSNMHKRTDSVIDPQQPPVAPRAYCPQKRKYHRQPHKNPSSPPKHWQFPTPQPYDLSAQQEGARQFMGWYVRYRIATDANTSTVVFEPVAAPLPFYSTFERPPGPRSDESRSASASDRRSAAQVS